MNLITLVGNIGNIKAIETTKTGKKMLKFSVATKYLRAGEDTPIWHNIVVFEKTAETCAKYLVPGMKVALSGQQINESWKTDAGEWKNYSSVTCSSIEFLNNPLKDKETAAKDIGTTGFGKNDSYDPNDMDNIPF